MKKTSICQNYELSKGFGRKKYLVTRIEHRRVIRLSIRGLITSEGSFGKPKNPRVACQIKWKGSDRMN